MPQYKAPLRDLQFVLHEMFDLESHYDNLPGGDGLDRETIDALLAQAGKFCENVLSPLNQSGDEEGCHWDDGVVTVPKGFKQAYEQYYENGLGNIDAQPEYGGQGFPPSLSLAVTEMTASANSSFSMYPGLTKAAIAALQSHGTDEQKQTYLPKMNTGVWSGTMCLTEAHCGTDLGLLRTKAEPVGDGTYRISGEKIFISAGEHDMSENIVHLVLARLPDAPPGTKGISLFVVPKFLPNADGSVGERNGVICASIEHKMGITASSTCVLAFEDAKATMVGKPNKGLRCMFTMMNVARIGTGMQGMALGELARQGAVAYAQERLQMRALTGPKAPDKPADPIIVHPDVRRMLLTQRALSEGSRMMVYYCGIAADIDRRKAGTAEAEQADALLELLTPICKAFMTDAGYESSNLGVQVFGGHGYIREYGMEQLIRDGRVLQIYEGTNGIQALDLLGRKVLGSGGAKLRLFTDIVREFCEQHAADAELREFIEPLSSLVGEWHELTDKILALAVKNPDEAGAASYDFISYAGYVCYAYLFARAAMVARRRLREGSEEREFYEAKLLTARFYFRRLLPRTRGLVETMLSGADDLMAMSEEAFTLA